MIIDFWMGVHSMSTRLFKNLKKLSTGPLHSERAFFKSQSKFCLKFFVEGYRINQLGSLAKSAQSKAAKLSGWLILWPSIYELKQNILCTSDVCPFILPR